MEKMIKVSSLVLFTLFFSFSQVFASEGWLTDFELAKKESKSKNRPILVDFSGSDWCGWCIKLDKEVFSQKLFKEYAKNNLVLLLLDFPQNKKQSEKLKKQNQQLAQKYKVRGFPTVLVMDHKGEVIKKTGYKRGGAENYIKHLKEIIAKAK